MSLSETRRLIFDSQHGFCQALGCLNKATEVHHRIHNTKTNRKLFPNFIDSPFNQVGLCRRCHEDSTKECFNISEDQAVLYEAWLKELKDGAYPHTYTTGGTYQGRLG
jgi:hypothetical protein